MSIEFKLRRGTTAQHSTFTGAEGEVTVDTTKDTLVVHDGVTPGGKPLLSATAGAVGTTNIADDAITAAKIAAGAVGTSEIATDAVTASEIAAGAVGTAELAANAVTLAKMARVGTAGQVLTSSGTGADPVYDDLPITPVNIQTFNATGTWTKPTGGQTMARIQLWGGGGGGARGGSNNGAGGGGGYNEVTVPISYLASTVTATVGAGGNGATSTANGASGGTTSFALATAWDGLTTVRAYGGGGGGYANGSGGGGGGQSGAGSVPTTSAGGNGGSPRIVQAINSSTGGTIQPMGTGAGTWGCYSMPGSGGIWHGGGGGVAGNSTKVGGNSIWGGGGGAGTGGTAGTSDHGGDGGVNAVGGAPGGGGGSSTTASGNGSDGADGRIVVTCW